MPAQLDLLAFTRRLINFRATHPVLRRRTFFQGRASGARMSPTSSGSTLTVRR